MSFYKVKLDKKNEMNGVLGCFIMAMTYNMILILYVIPSKLSRDFSKLTILYIGLYIFCTFSLCYSNIKGNHLLYAMAHTFARGRNCTLFCV